MAFLLANTPASWALLWAIPAVLPLLALFARTRLPAQGAVRAIDAFSTLIAEAVKWLALAMVVMVAGLVIARYVFGLTTIKAQESVLYMHALLFLLAAPAALLTNGHVRVDIIYEKLGPRGRAWVDLAGSLLLLAPVAIVIFKYGGAYAARAWAIHEGSPEVNGLPLVYWLKTAIPVFAVLMLLQGAAMAARAAFVLADRPLAGPQAVEEVI